MKAHAIIVAAGKGVRMQQAVPKQYLEIDGRPLICHTLAAFEACRRVEHIYLVIPKSDFEFYRKALLPPMKLQTALTLVGGGPARQASVYNGLLAIDPQAALVVIHDGVRPLVGPKLISACIEGAQQTGACIPGLPAADTVKRVKDDGYIAATLPRQDIWLAQTPQAFSHDLIRKAHENARQDGISGTDDAALVERIGHPVRIIRGSAANIKVTTPDDLGLAKAIFAERKRAAK